MGCGSVRPFPDRHVSAALGRAPVGEPVVNRSTSFGERVLPVDAAVARRSAALHVPDPRPVRDSLIAATALVHGLSVVTRNVADFAPTGAEVIDPWQPANEPT